MANVIYVDDRDPTITYSPSDGWYLGGTYPEYDNTTHGSNLVGTPMEISFSFQGTRVIVYGTVAPATGHNIIPPVSYYKVDNTPAVTYTAPASQNTQYNQSFYDSGDLADGVHTVIINPLTTQNSTLWFDYYTYLPSSGNLAPSPLSSSSTSEISSTTSTSSTALPQPSPFSSSSHSKSSTVPIIAGTLGSVTGLALIAILAVFLRWRHKRSYSSSLARRSILSTSYEHDARTVLSSEVGSSGHRPGWSVTSASNTVSPPYPDIQPSFVSSPKPLSFNTVTIATSAPSIISDPPTTIVPPPPQLPLALPAPPACPTLPVPATLMEPPQSRVSVDGGLRLNGGPLQNIDLPPTYQQYD